MKRLYIVVDRHTGKKVKDDNGIVRTFSDKMEAKVLRNQKNQEVGSENFRFYVTPEDLH